MHLFTLSDRKSTYSYLISLFFLKYLGQTADKVLLAALIIPLKWILHPYLLYPLLWMVFKYLFKTDVSDKKN